MLSFPAISYIIIPAYLPEKLPRIIFPHKALLRKINYKPHVRIGMSQQVHTRPTWPHSYHNICPQYWFHLISDRALESPLQGLEEEGGNWGGKDIQSSQGKLEKTCLPGGLFLEKYKYKVWYFENINRKVRKGSWKYEWRRAYTSYKLCLYPKC